MGRRPVAGGLQVTKALSVWALLAAVAAFLTPWTAAVVILGCASIVLALTALILGQARADPHTRVRDEPSAALAVVVAVGSALAAMAAMGRLAG